MTYKTERPGMFPSPVVIPGKCHIYDRTDGRFEIEWYDDRANEIRDEWPRDLCPPHWEWPKTRITNGDPPRLGPGRRALRRVLKVVSR